MIIIWTIFLLICYNVNYYYILILQKDFDDSSEDEISVEKKRAKEAGDWEIESENNKDGDEVKIAIVLNENVK